MTIGSRIKKYRKEQKLTQRALAEKATMSRSYLADVENGRYNPSVDVLKSLATALDINLSLLVDEETISPSETIEFTNGEEAMKYILQQPALMALGGYDLESMNESELIEFANELLNQFKILSYKYKK